MITRAKPLDYFDTFVEDLRKPEAKLLRRLFRKHMQKKLPHLVTKNNETL